ncbi:MULTISPECIES: hypothetical protein [unclassified Myxococcus]|uniref:hypothetical protein n=1 Tax=unclassified Myxococcus TaxID=2648731 RepID=UPI00157B109D|nr:MULTISPECIES: hypothetical protein [unclassified Myxococcus]NTX03748.1 hypothetical protein [Myxococcus sp. CA040A]NTX14089.1 hypothetical protein [Myxococcus sp. CA056]
MRMSRLAIAVTTFSFLSLAACGGVEAAADAPDSTAPVSVEQGIGIPPNCPNNDLVYWLENVQACVAKCGTTRKNGQPATLYAGCQSNLTQTRTLIDVRYCVPDCELA